MAKKSTYNCILYDIGDKVKEKHGSDEVLEIENATVRYVGIYPCQFLKFKNKEDDPGNFSNLFIPAAETVEKYKDGLKYFEEVKVKTKQNDKSIKTGTKIHEQLAKVIRAKSNVLTEEDLKPRVVPVGMFKTKSSNNG
jgi:hypothetical protein